MTVKKITFHDLLGKVILIGLTYYSHDNELIGQKQYWGTVIEANKKGFVFSRITEKSFLFRRI